MSDRDFLSKVQTIFFKEGNGFVSTTNSIYRADVPLKKGVIRGE